RLFDEHKAELVQLTADIRATANAVRDDILHQPFDIAKQREFGLSVVEKYGHDLKRGRLDTAVHPFATHFSINDVRITTRFNSDWLNPALFGTMHEAGHAMYEQGISLALEDTPLA